MSKLKNIQITNYYYEPSDSRIVQGNDDYIRKCEMQGYYVAKGGNGTYRMNKPSTAKVEFVVDGELKVQSVKTLIREYYGITRVTKSKLEQFLIDFGTDEFDLKYSDETGLVIEQ